MNNSYDNRFQMQVTDDEKIKPLVFLVYYW